ncbi:hypothetical protein [Gemmiger formicilis]|uniref:hypothetical protein n=1 Tax=Gemmiger formicilis TaxID=745368 RepID=UPI001A9A8ED4|nr:hypothetical protein [Gemmiger formicilis]
MAGVSAMMIGLVACGSKAESNIAESATPAPTAEATPTPEPTEEPAESHDFDSSVNKYKSESDIEIKQYSGDSASDMADCDSGTDIEDIDTLYDWLYNNGVTRESVQNDRDSGCKNPYLDGYLEYLDSLDKPSETPSKSLDDYEVAEDGEVIIDDWSSLVGGGSDSDVQSGFDGIEDKSDELREKVQSGELQRKAEEIQARHPDLDF